MSPRDRPAHGSRRWKLTPEEQERIADLRSAPVQRSEVLRTLAGSPAVLRDLVMSAGRGATRAARAEVAWAVANHRVRSVVPDAATGVAWRGEEAFVEALRPRLGPGVRAVEIGCGGGRVADLVAPLVGELCCSDISATMLAEATENLAEHGNVTFVRTAGLDLGGLPDDSFDVAFAHDVLINIEADAAIALLDAMHRVLRPGGTCVVSVYTADRAAWAADQLARIRRLAPRGEMSISHPRTYFAEQVTRLLEIAGFEELDCSYDETDPASERAHYIVVARAVEAVS